MGYYFTKKHTTFFPLWVTVLLLSFSFAASAQTAVIKGKVSSTTGPIENASVWVKGQNTNTDADGNYSLKVSAGKNELSVSYVGYKTQTQNINARDGETINLDFVLQPASQLDEVVVVGTRNPKRSATESPVPVDVIPLKQIANQVGQLELTQLLTFLAPSFNSVRQSLGDATDQTDPAQLRGLGPDQVLVLVNGKRYHQTSLVNVNGTVNKGTTGTDLNSIPASSIDHIEILRDGAAAQYGSDAIAGVINIVLKKTKGFNMTASFGENASSYDKNYGWNLLHPTQQLSNKANVTDGQNYQIGVNYGVPLKKGHLEISGEYLRRNKSNRTGLYTGQLWPKVNGSDQSDAINQQKGLTRNNFDMWVGNSEMKQGGGVLDFAYPISSHLEVYAFGIANFKNGLSGGFYRYPYQLDTTSGAGKFPSSLGAASYNAAHIVSGLYPNGFLPLETEKFRDYSFTAGVRGDLGKWKADLSETYGYNSIQYGVKNSVNYTQAYVPGTTSANLQTQFNAGRTNVYQAVTNLDVSRGFPVLQGLNTAFGAEFRVDGYGITQGELSSYANLVPGTHAIDGLAGAQVFSGFLPSNAGSWSRNNVAVYTDNELDITKALLITGALRYEHYSDFGSTLNYKFSARYKVTNWLTFRASTSSGFRAPSLAQEHYSKVSTLFQQTGGVYVPVLSGTFPNNSQVAEVLGIPRLKQETSHSYSVGFTATITKGLDLTVDAYQINIKNRIILSNAFTGGSDTTLTKLLGNAGAQSASVFANAIDTRSRGIEGVLSYTKNFGHEQSLNISLAHSTNVNKVLRNPDGTLRIHASDVLIGSGQVGKYFTRADESRIEDYTPRNKDILTVQYRYKKFGAFVRGSYFGQVKNLADSTGAGKALATNTSGGNYALNAYDGGKLETTDQVFSGKFLTDLGFTYYLNKNVSINIGANNIFNVYPDKITNSANSNTGVFTYSRAVSQFGFNGRYVFGKLTISL